MTKNPSSSSVAPSPSTGASGFDVDAAVDVLVRALDATAVERDRVGGHAPVERALIRNSGLLGLIVPVGFGGLGRDWATLYSVVRRLSRVDSALGHVFAFHHLQVSSVLLYGNAEQQGRLLRATILERIFWGNALNPLDKGLRATEEAGGWRLSGVKSYASGSVGSDRLVISATVEAPAGSAPLTLIGNIATHAPGVQVREDWDAFGQRQTDSGSVGFDNVFLPDEDVFLRPGYELSPRQTLRTIVSQLIMTNVYLGIAEGAFESARAFIGNVAKPWFLSGVARAGDDPYIQHRLGQLWLLVRPAQLVADAAALRLQAALQPGHEVTTAERAEVAIEIAEAKVLAHRAAVDVSSQFFELTGARSTSGRYGFDRYWRNARVHTLHDPVDYKLRDIGRYRLDGRPPEPTSYS